jgi:tetratricopeptide (TPR) repeat protein
MSNLNISQSMSENLSLNHSSLRRFGLVILTIMLVISCKNSWIEDQFKSIESNQSLPGGIIMEYPLEGTIFPPEIPEPLFLWNDNQTQSGKWHIRISLEKGEIILHEIVESPSWRPGLAVWEMIKQVSGNQPIYFTIIGNKRKSGGKEFISGRTSFSFSKDSVGAAIFYRAVPLPFSYAVNNVNKIEWYSGNIQGGKPQKVLENIPVCANCHSFSAKGVCAMDVDYANDKGSYIISALQDTVHMTLDKIITWSDYKRTDGELTFGLLSQISPDGRFAISTVKDRSVFVPVDNLEYSQLFFPIKGILAVYDRESKKFYELNGANNPDMVQSNPNWSPDGKDVLFSRAERYKSSKIENTTSVLLRVEDVEEFINRKKPFKYDVYRVPFNNGKGGKAVPLSGASTNNKSNFFARYSPDGRWIVFCQSSDFMLLQPDSKLYIMPAQGGIPRLMSCNTKNMNSWHSWSPNSKWLVFSSKSKGPYTQLFLTHIDEKGNDSPPVFLENMTFEKKAANIPEFYDQKATGLRALVDDFSKNAMYYSRLASTYIQENKFIDAQKSIEEAIKADSNYFDAYENKLILNFLLRNSRSKNDLSLRAKAFRLIDQVIKDHPADIMNYLKRGHLFLLTGNTEGALRDALYVLKRDPENYKGYELTVDTYEKMGQYEKAITYLHKMNTLQPDNIGITFDLAANYRSTNQLDKAKSILDDLITRFPKRSTFYISRAMVSIMKRDLKSAKDDYNKAVACDPGNYLVYRDRGAFYKNTVAPDLAAADFKTALDLVNKEIAKNSQDALLYIARAEIYELAGDKQAMLAEYENYIKQWPPNYTVLGKLGQERFSSKQHQLAIETFTILVDNFPGDATAFFHRGVAFQETGKFQDALRDFNNAIQYGPGNYLYYYMRADLKEKMHDQPGFIKDLEQTYTLLKDKQRKTSLNKQEQEVFDYISEVFARRH